VNARPPRAVAAGNVGRRRIVDVVGARSARPCLPAQGQGTMNNVTLGNARFILRMIGAMSVPGRGRAEAVHVTMSNTLATPVEALELGYPIRAERWARLGSGGTGRSGGDGVVRDLCVLEDCRLGRLERREASPQGG
jgi:N-methylhydantoinase B/oxoprolinase/acetone carboxylase alpha subunit